MSSQVAGTPVLVTGGAGFIGSHLAERLVAEGARVTVADDLSFGRREHLPAGADHLEVDVRHYPSVRRAVRGQELVFHLAANATTKETSMGWADPQTDYEINAVGTLNVLRAIQEEGSGARMVFTSTAAVYGHVCYLPIDERHPTEPVSPYGVSKLTGEKYCLAYGREHGIPATILRVFNTYGPRQPRYVMHDLIAKLRRDPTVLPIIGDGTQIRDYTYIDDAVDAFLLAGRYPGETLNVSSGVGTSIMEVAERIRDALAPGAPIVSEGSTWRGDIPTLVGDNRRLRSKGFAPKVDLETGIRRLIAASSISGSPDGVVDPGVEPAHDGGQAVEAGR